MADVDRMFRSELAVLAEQHSQIDHWDLDPALDAPSKAVPFDDDAANWDTSLDIHPALGLFPTLDRRLGGPAGDPFPQPTVHLTDVSLGTHAPLAMPVPVPPIQIPLSATSSSSGPPSSLSPTDSLVPTDPWTSSSEMEMDSDDPDFVYPSDSEYLPSPISIDPASLSAPCSAFTSDPNAEVLTNAPATRPSRRGFRSISKVPVPIPNLTKKSRGRKVPTSNGEPIYAASRDKSKKGVRTYTCHADGCGKCFVRGEHLKRHIRSIHTEEKRAFGPLLTFFFASSLLAGSPCLLQSMGVHVHGLRPHIQQAGQPKPTPAHPQAAGR